MEHKDWIAVIVLVGIVSIFLTIFTFFGIEQGLQRITGQVTGVANVTVYTTTDISIVKSNVYLGNLTFGGSNSTLNATQGDGFQIQNDGNVAVNVSISATNLFTTATNPTTNYRYLVSDAGEGATNTSTFKQLGTTLVWTNVPSVATVAIAFLNETDTKDIAEIDINVTIPSGEAAGLKESTVTFTGVAAE